MKKLFILFISLLAIQFAFSKDFIIKKDGFQIECTVNKQDSINVYYTTMANGLEVNATINNTAIKEILYNKQSASDTIYIEKKGLGYKYTLNGKELSMNNLSDILQHNKDAIALFKQAKGTAGVANVFGFIGGFCIGYGLFSSIALVGIGAGILLIDIPILISAENTLKDAVLIHNNDIKGGTKTENQSKQQQQLPTQKKIEKSYFNEEN
jgi:hypothetical protein